MGSMQHFLSFVGKQIRPDELAQVQDFGVQLVQVAAGRVEVAADSHQADQSPGSMKRVHVLLDGVAPLDGGGFGFCKRQCCPAYGFCRDAYGFCNAFGCKRMNMLSQFIEPVRPIGYKILIITFFPDDYLQESQRQGVVGSGTDGQPLFSLACQGSLARIHDNDACSCFDLVEQRPADFAFLVGGCQIAAPKDDQLALVKEIGHRIKTAGVQAGDFTRCMTNILGGHDIGGPEQVGQAYQGKVLHALGHALAEGNAPGTIGSFRFRKAMADFR